MRTSESCDGSPRAAVLQTLCKTCQQNTKQAKRTKKTSQGAVRAGVSGSRFSTQDNAQTQKQAPTAARHSRAERAAPCVEADLAVAKAREEVRLEGAVRGGARGLNSNYFCHCDIGYCALLFFHLKYSILLCGKYQGNFEENILRNSVKCGCKSV